MLEVVGIEHAALASLDLQVGAGELVALVGRSGAGKSIALRILAGFEAPSAGAVWIAGREVTAAAPAQRDLAAVFPDQPLFAHLTVFENLAFALRVRRLPDVELTSRVHAAAKALGVQPLLGRATHHLSGGERQRIAIAGALARAPRVLLFDEPLAHLDPAARVEVGRRIARAVKQAGAAAVLATSDPAALTGLVDRVVDLAPDRPSRIAVI